MSEATTAVVADTHILIWYVLSPAKLSHEARQALEECTSANETIRVSAFSLVELAYAMERANNPFSEQDRQDVLEVLAAADSPFEVVELSAEVANKVASVPRANNADPGDRIVVATAETLGLSIVSADSKLPAMTELAVIS